MLAPHHLGEIEQHLREHRERSRTSASAPVNQDARRGRILADLIVAAVLVAWIIAAALT